MAISSKKKKKTSPKKKVTVSKGCALENVGTSKRLLNEETSSVACCSRRTRSVSRLSSISTHDEIILTPNKRNPIVQRTISNKDELDEGDSNKSRTKIKKEPLSTPSKGRVFKDDIDKAELHDVPTPKKTQSRQRRRSKNSKECEDGINQKSLFIDPPSHENDIIPVQCNSENMAPCFYDLPPDENESSNSFKKDTSSIKVCDATMEVGSEESEAKNYSTLLKSFPPSDVSSESHSQHLCQSRPSYVTNTHSTVKFSDNRDCGSSGAVHVNDQTSVLFNQSTTDRTLVHESLVSPNNSIKLNVDKQPSSLSSDDTDHSTRRRILLESQRRLLEQMKLVEEQLLLEGVHITPDKTFGNTSSIVDDFDNSSVKGINVDGDLLDKTSSSENESKNPLHTFKDNVISQLNISSTPSKSNCKTEGEQRVILPQDADSDVTSAFGKSKNSIQNHDIAFIDSSVLSDLSISKDPDSSNLIDQVDEFINESSPSTISIKEDSKHSTYSNSQLKLKTIESRSINLIDSDAIETRNRTNYSTHNKGSKKLKVNSKRSSIVKVEEDDWSFNASEEKLNSIELGVDKIRKSLKTEPSDSTPKIKKSERIQRDKRRSNNVCNICLSVRRGRSTRYSSKVKCPHGKLYPNNEEDENSHSITNPSEGSSTIKVKQEVFDHDLKASDHEIQQTTTPKIPRKINENIKKKVNTSILKLEIPVEAALNSTLKDNDSNLIDFERFSTNKVEISMKEEDLMEACGDSLDIKTTKYSSKHKSKLRPMTKISIYENICKTNRRSLCKKLDFCEEADMKNDHLNPKNSVNKNTATEVKNHPETEPKFIESIFSFSSGSGGGGILKYSDGNKDGLDKINDIHDLRVEIIEKRSDDVLESTKEVSKICVTSKTKENTSFEKVDVLEQSFNKNLTNQLENIDRHSLESVGSGLRLDSASVERKCFKNKPNSPVQISCNNSKTVKDQKEELNMLNDSLNTAIDITVNEIGKKSLPICSKAHKLNSDSSDEVEKPEKKSKTVIGNNNFQVLTVCNAEIKPKTIIQSEEDKSVENDPDMESFPPLIVNNKETESIINVNITEKLEVDNAKALDLDSACKSKQLKLRWKKSFDQKQKSENKINNEERRSSIKHSPSFCIDAKELIRASYVILTPLEHKTRSKNKTEKLSPPLKNKKKQVCVEGIPSIEKLNLENCSDKDKGDFKKLGKAKNSMEETSVNNLENVSRENKKDIVSSKSRKDENLPKKKRLESYDPLNRNSWSKSIELQQPKTNGKKVKTELKKEYSNEDKCLDNSENNEKKPKQTATIIDGTNKIEIFEKKLNSSEKDLNVNLSLKAKKYNLQENRKNESNSKTISSSKSDLKKGDKIKKEHHQTSKLEKEKIISKNAVSFSKSKINIKEEEKSNDDSHSKNKKIKDTIAKATEKDCSKENIQDKKDQKKSSKEREDEKMSDIGTNNRLRRENTPSENVVTPEKNSTSVKKLRLCEQKDNKENSSASFMVSEQKISQVEAIHSPIIHERPVSNYNVDKIILSSQQKNNSISGKIDAKSTICDISNAHLNKLISDKCMDEIESPTNINDKNESLMSAKKSPEIKCQPQNKESSITVQAGNSLDKVNFDTSEIISETNTNISYVVSPCSVPFCFEMIDSVNMVPVDISSPDNMTDTNFSLDKASEDKCFDTTSTLKNVKQSTDKLSRPDNLKSKSNKPVEKIGFCKKELYIEGIKMYKFSSLWKSTKKLAEIKVPEEKLFKLIPEKDFQIPIDEESKPQIDEFHRDEPMECTVIHNACRSVENFADLDKFFLPYCPELLKYSKCARKDCSFVHHKFDHLVMKEADFSEAWCHVEKLFNKSEGYMISVEAFEGITDWLGSLGKRNKMLEPCFYLASLPIETDSKYLSKCWTALLSAYRKTGVNQFHAVQNILQHLVSHSTDYSIEVFQNILVYLGLMDCSIEDVWPVVQILKNVPGFIFPIQFIECMMLSAIGDNRPFTKDFVGILLDFTDELVEMKPESLVPIDLDILNNFSTYLINSKLNFCDYEIIAKLKALKEKLKELTKQDMSSSSENYNTIVPNLNQTLKSKNNTINTILVRTEKETSFKYLESSFNTNKNQSKNAYVSETFKMTVDEFTVNENVNKKSVSDICTSNVAVLNISNPSDEKSINSNVNTESYKAVNLLNVNSCVKPLEISIENTVESDSTFSSQSDIVLISPKSTRIPLIRSSDCFKSGYTSDSSMSSESVSRLDKLERTNNTGSVSKISNKLNVNSCDDTLKHFNDTSRDLKNPRIVFNQPARGFKRKFNKRRLSFNRNKAPTEFINPWEQKPIEPWEVPLPFQAATPQSLITSYQSILSNISQRFPQDETKAGPNPDFQYKRSLSFPKRGNVSSQRGRSRHNMNRNFGNKSSSFKKNDTEQQSKKKFDNFNKPKNNNRLRTPNYKYNTVRPHLSRPGASGVNRDMRNEDTLNEDDVYQDTSSSSCQDPYETLDSRFDVFPREENDNLIEENSKEDENYGKTFIETNDLSKNVLIGKQNFVVPIYYEDKTKRPLLNQQFAISSYDSNVEENQNFSDDTASDVDSVSSKVQHYHENNWLDAPGTSSIRGNIPKSQEFIQQHKFTAHLSDDNESKLERQKSQVVSNVQYIPVKNKSKMLSLPFPRGTIQNSEEVMDFSSNLKPMGGSYTINPIPSLIANKSNPCYQNIELTTGKSSHMSSQDNFKNKSISIKMKNITITPQKFQEIRQSMVHLLKEKRLKEIFDNACTWSENRKVMENLAFSILEAFKSVDNTHRYLIIRDFFHILFEYQQTNPERNSYLYSLFGTVATSIMVDSIKNEFWKNAYDVYSLLRTTGFSETINERFIGGGENYSQVCIAIAICEVLLHMKMYDDAVKIILANKLLMEKDQWVLVGLEDDVELVRQISSVLLETMCENTADNELIFNFLQEVIESQKSLRNPINVIPAVEAIMAAFHDSNPASKKEIEWLKDFFEYLKTYDNLNDLSDLSLRILVINFIRLRYWRVDEIYSLCVHRKVYSDLNAKDSFLTIKSCWQKEEMWLILNKWFETIARHLRSGGDFGKNEFIVKYQLLDASRLDKKKSPRRLLLIGQKIEEVHARFNQALSVCNPPLIYESIILEKQTVKLHAAQCQQIITRKLKSL